MMTYIGKFKELCPKHQDFPSIKESFCNEPYIGQDRIVLYLKTGGKEDMMSLAIRKDVITGDPIHETDFGRNDGVFTWWTSLAYYVEKYNLRLPEEFEKHVLAS